MKQSAALAQSNNPLAASQNPDPVLRVGQGPAQARVGRAAEALASGRLARGRGRRCLRPRPPALTITVPKPQTESAWTAVRSPRLRDRNPDEIIRTALGADGAVSIQWRPKVAEGQVDRTLTAASAAVLDVQEDGLRLAWRLDLEFRRSQRERFDVGVPAEFLLEKVEGNNVRGWEIRKTRPGAEGRESRLLQAAKDHEQLTLVLWRAAAGRSSDWPSSTCRWSSVSDAALHNGQLTIRRSPLLELQTLSRSGVTRTDLPNDAAESRRTSGK